MLAAPVDLKDIRRRKYLANVSQNFIISYQGKGGKNIKALTDLERLIFMRSKRVTDVTSERSTFYA